MNNCESLLNAKKKLFQNLHITVTSFGESFSNAEI